MQLSRGLFRNLTSSLRRPADSAPTLPAKIKLLGTVRILVITLLWSLLSGLIVGLFPQVGQNAVVEALDEFTWVFALFGIGYAAIYEELAFRAFLRPGRLALGFGLGFWIWFWLVNVGELPVLEVFFRDEIFTGIDTLLTPFIFGGLTYALLFYAPLYRWLRRVHANGSRWILWISIFSFAWVHALNFANALDNWYLAPLLTLPQFLIALGLSAVRLRYGFEYAVLLHGLNNAFGIVVAISVLEGTARPDTSLGLTLLLSGSLLFVGTVLGSIFLNVQAFWELHRTRLSK